MCDNCGCHDPEPEKKIKININESLLSANDAKALENQKVFNEMGAIALNLISSPGAGKTTLLERTIDRLKNKYTIGVIEGDIETERDAERIRKKGVPAVQITTGGACHLDAPIINKGITELKKISNQDKFDFIFIENVGNLVCPASFFLGEHKRVTLLSVTEGSDKPEKYPKAFITSDLFLITKIDILPYFQFSIDEAINEAKKLNPSIDIISLSSVTEDGMDMWIDYLEKLIKK
jgi:hydrogenase nickel incorporation protein HypB